MENGLHQKSLHYQPYTSLCMSPKELIWQHFLFHLRTFFASLLFSSTMFQSWSLAASLCSSRMSLAAQFLHPFIRQLKEVIHSVLNLHSARLNKPRSPSPSSYVLCSPLCWTWKRTYALCNYLSPTWNFFWNPLKNCHHLWLSSGNAFCQAQVKHLWRMLFLCLFRVLIPVLTKLLRF